MGGMTDEFGVKTVLFTKNNGKRAEVEGAIFSRRWNWNIAIWNRGGYLIKFVQHGGVLGRKHPQKKGPSLATVWGWQG